MQDATGSRRGLVKAGLAAAAAFSLSRHARARAAPAEIKLPENIPVERFDFETNGIEGWTTVDGQWAVEDMAGAPSGKKVLVQRATKNEFNVIVAPPGPFTDVDVSMKFKPISGREDASGGIVFRFTDGKYYVIRANALEDNFRLYYYDRGRYQLASAGVKAPALGQWHAVRVVALGDPRRDYPRPGHVRERVPHTTAPPRRSTLMRSCRTSTGRTWPGSTERT